MTKSFFNQAIYIFVSSQSILCSCSGGCTTGGDGECTASPARRGPEATLLRSPPRWFAPPGRCEKGPRGRASATFFCAFTPDAGATFWACSRSPSIFFVQSSVSSAFSSLSLDFLFPSPLSSSRYSPLPRVTSSLLSSSLYCILSLFSTIYCLYELFFPCIVLLLQFLVAFL
jgi:hypothetical protein